MDGHTRSTSTKGNVFGKSDRRGLLEETVQKRSMHQDAWLVPRKEFTVFSDTPRAKKESADEGGDIVSRKLTTGT